jgi:anti-sigma28 factor (negative regulator of flagellin synthesis)
VGRPRERRNGETDDQRRARLEDIRRRVRDGSYQVDLDRLAERVLPELDGDPDDDAKD